MGKPFDAVKEQLRNGGMIVDWDVTPLLASLDGHKQLEVEVVVGGVVGEVVGTEVLVHPPVPGQVRESEVAGLELVALESLQYKHGRELSRRTDRLLGEEGARNLLLHTAFMVEFPPEAGFFVVKLAALYALAAGSDGNKETGRGRIRRARKKLHQLDGEQEIEDAVTAAMLPCLGITPANAIVVSFEDAVDLLAMAMKS